MSIYYKDYHKLYNEKIVSAQIVDQPLLKLLLLNLFKLFTLLKINFNKNNIKFKSFDF